MNLRIDGMEITAAPGERLLDLARRLGLVTGKLSTTPLAAKIAGEVHLDVTVLTVTAGLLLVVTFNHGDIRVLKMRRVFM